MVKLDTLTKAIAKSRFSKIIDGGNGYYYAGDITWLIKIHANLFDKEPQDVVLAGQGVFTLETMENFMKGSGDEVTVNGKTIKEFIMARRYNKKFKDLPVYQITENHFINPKILQIFFDVTKEEEGTFFVPPSPYDLIHCRMDGIEFVMAPLKYKGCYEANTAIMDKPKPTRGVIYFVQHGRDNEESYGCMTWDKDSYNYYQQSEENAMEYIEKCNGFIRYATKKEYDEWLLERAKERMEKAVAANDFPTIENYMINNDNVFSIKALSEIIGIKLSKTMKERMEQIKEYYGEAWTAWKRDEEKRRIDREKALKECERKQKEEEIKGIANRFKANQRISGNEFVKLCDYYNVKMHLRTRGYCLNSLVKIQKDGNYWCQKGTNSSKLWDSFDELIKKLEG